MILLQGKLSWNFTNSSCLMIENGVIILKIRESHGQKGAYKELFIPL
jgi:hypothetical protein